MIRKRQRPHNAAVANADKHPFREELGKAVGQCTPDVFAMTAVATSVER
jgi:hypothetical protein